MGPVEENPAAPFGNDFAHCRNWIGKQGHREPQRDEFRANLPRDSGKQGEIDFELGRIERDVHDPESAQAGGAVDTIARMTTDGLGGTHDYVAGRGERLIDSQIPQHCKRCRLGRYARIFGRLRREYPTSRTEWRREMDLNRRDPSFRRYNEHMSEQNRRPARLIERLWAAACAILKSGASQFRIGRMIHPLLRRWTCGFPELWQVKTSCRVRDGGSLSSQVSIPAVRPITAWLVWELGR